MGLQESILNNSTETGMDYAAKSSSAPDPSFKLRLDAWVSLVVKRNKEQKADLNAEIADIVKKNSLNNDQMQRIIEEVNNQVYLERYKQLANKSVRDVNFEIADATKIKDLINPAAPVNQETVVDPKTKTEDTGNQEKVASFSGERNFLNHTAYKTIGIGSTTADKDAGRRIMESKISEKIASVLGDFEKASSELQSNVSELGEAIFKVARVHGNPQEVFEKLAKKATLTKGEQILIKKAYVDHVDFSVKMRKIASFPTDIELVDGLAGEEKAISLGAHSFFKKASETSEPLPPVATSKRLINNYDNLIEMAMKVRAQQQALTQKEEAKKAILSAASKEKLQIQ